MSLRTSAGSAPAGADAGVGVAVVVEGAPRAVNGCRRLLVDLVPAKVPLVFEPALTAPVPVVPARAVVAPEVAVPVLVAMPVLVVAGVVLVGVLGSSSLVPYPALEAKLFRVVIDPLSGVLF